MKAYPAGRGDLWLTEFGEAAGVPEAIALDPDLHDISWHNDVAPSFIATRLAEAAGDTLEFFPRLWVHPPNPADREDPELPRYGVTDDTPHGEFAWRTLYEGDDLLEAVRILKARSAEIEVA